MKKYFTVILCIGLLIFGAIEVQAKGKTRTVTTQKIIDNSFNYNAQTYPRLTQIERSLFRKSYEKQDLATRLNRIENSIFSTTYPQYSYAQRVDNIIANCDNSSINPNLISKRTLSQMEADIFNQQFPHDNDETRISRLEQKLLGATQSGNLQNRLATIKQVIRNNNNYAYGIPTMTPTYPTPNTSGNILKTVGNILTGRGTMTGFSPSFNTYSNPYMNNNPFYSYGNPHYNVGGHGMNSGWVGNRGWGLNNRDIGTGTTVRILN